MHQVLTTLGAALCKLARTALVQSSLHVQVMAPRNVIHLTRVLRHADALICQAACAANSSTWQFWVSFVAPVSLRC